MQHEFQPEENQTSLAAKPVAPLAVETEPDAQVVADIIKRLDEITRRANRVSRWISVSQIVTSIAWMSCLWIIPMLTRRDNPLRPMLYLALSTIWGVSLMASFWLRFRTTPKFDAIEIARIGGIKAIIPLFATLQNTISKKQKHAIHDALKTLLPQMKASDAYLLTPYARGTINGWLNITADYSTIHAYPDDLRIAALKALEQVGDTSAISFVERLTTIMTDSRSQAQLKQAAIECLPMLRANCGEVEAARTLLRASHAEAARPDTLLRPASGAGQTAAQELLRPSDEESGP